MTRFRYALAAGGMAWLSLVLWLIISNAIVREIQPIGALAEFLDKLPPAVSATISILLWLVFLVGWIVPLIFGARPLFARRPPSVPK